MSRMSHPRIFVLSLIAACALALGVLIAAAGDAVTPVSTDGVWLREESVKQLGDTSYYRETTLLLTNCYAYTGSVETNTAVQGFDGVTIELRYGTAGGTNNTAVTGYAGDGNTNFWASFTLPDTDDTYIQLKITDENTNSYIYPWKVIKLKEAME